jgi:hypothetical protein
MFSYAILCEEQSPVDSHLSVPSRSCCIAGISRSTLGKKWSALRSARQLNNLVAIIERETTSKEIDSPCYLGIHSR